MANTTSSANLRGRKKCIGLENKTSGRKQKKNHLSNYTVYYMAQVTSDKIARCDWLLTRCDWLRPVMTAGIMKIVNVQ